MATALNLRKLLHRPAFELCNAMPATSAVGMYSVAAQVPAMQLLFCAHVTSKDALIYEYDPVTDTELLLPTSGVTGTFGAGACGCVVPLGPTGTASAGTTTTITTTLTLVRDLRGFRVRITGGTNAGQERVIASNTLGANGVITVTAVFGTGAGVACDNTSVFLLLTPRMWIWCPPTATQSLSYWDFATSTWVSRVSTGVTLAGTDGQMVSTAAALGNKMDSSDSAGNAAIATSTNTGFTLAAASSNVPPSLSNSGRNWVTNEWAGGVVQILAGTGQGQTRHITANVANALTVDVAWTVNPDSTSVWQITKAFASSGSNGAVFVSHSGTVLTLSGVNWAASQWVNCQLRAIAGAGAGQVRTITASSATTVTVAAETAFDATTIWVIEGNDDNIYLTGNAAVALFKYTIAGNTWSTLAPGTARPAGPGAGMSLHWVTQINDPVFNTENAIKNGRYLYSFRGAGTATLDQYDIAANNWLAASLTYGNQQEVFNTGCQWGYLNGRYAIVNQAITGRYFVFDYLLNELSEIGAHMFTQGAALAGNRMILVNYRDGSLSLPILIHWMNTTTGVVRSLLWPLV